MKTMALTCVLTAIACSSPAHLLWVAMNTTASIAHLLIH